VCVVPEEGVPSVLGVRHTWLAAVSIASARHGIGVPRRTDVSDIMRF
jgi:hypothetical protein